MKRKSLLFLLLIALMAPWAAVAQSPLTVYDGTDNSEKVPFDGWNADGAQHNQMIFPATALSEMNGKNITQVVFYIDESANNGSYTASDRLGTWTVSLGETTATTLTGLDNTTTVSQVYQGYFDCSSGTTLTLTFADGYPYNGGNLLVDLNHAAASYNRWYFLGENQTNNTAITKGTLYKFLPKTSFYYQNPPAFPSPRNLQISDVTAQTATASWQAPTTATPTGYQYQYKDATTSTWPDTWNSINDTHKDLTSLASLTTYDFRVRANYTEGDSDPIETQFTTKAQAVAVGNSWTDDFEGTKCGWELINGTVTQANWFWGTAEHNGSGSHSIYTTKDNGNTCSYNTDGGARIYATKLLTFADGKYTFQFDWKCNGETTSYDYLSVGLLPATAVITADNTTTSTLPTGWISVHDATYLNGVTAWQTSPEKTVQLEAGNYYLVLRWRQDESYGTGTGAAVDNFSITKVACDYDVTGLAVATDPAPTAHTATINWTGEASQWQVAWSTDNTFAAANTNTEIVSATTINLSSLLASSTYYVKVRAYCGGEDYGTWCSAINFNTECEAITTFPWEEKFESHAAGDFSAPCWVNTTVSGSYKFKVTTYSNGSNSTHQLYSPSSSNAVAKLVLPEMTIPTGKDYQFIIDVYRTTSSTSYDDGIRVYASTDGNLEDATELGFLYRVCTKTDNGVVTAETTTGWYTYTFDIPFDGSCFIILQGEGKGGSNTYVDNLIVRQAPDCATPTGLAVTSGSQTPEGATITWTAGDASSWIVEYKKSTEENYIAIAEPVNAATYTFTGLDASTTYNVRVKVNCTAGSGVTYPTEPVNFTTQQGCPAPKNLVVTGITASQAVLTWTPGYNETEWTVKYKKNGSTDEYTTAPTVSGTPTITLTGLDGATSYAVQIYGCDATHVYTVSNAFTTAYSSPFEEKFAASSRPTSWNNYKVMLNNDVLNGTTPLSGTGSWGFSNTYVFGQYHATLNIYGTECKSWLVTPNITVGTGYSLGFDLALTDYNYATQIEDLTAQADDKFVVLISTDNGTHWTIMRQWDNVGSDFVYNNIATGGETVYIDLADYSGQTVRIAFYGESTNPSDMENTGGDNDLHIDNVTIDVTPTCYKPGKPAASNVTNHSATLTWTAGEEGQTAWQIAYKKGESFDPNAAGFDLSTVDVEDVEALTYTFDKTLDAASTYYVYVRANCGSNDYSKWCSNVCSFTTKIELPAPTSLTVANVMPTSLDLGWTVGGGDYEESWDIIYATSSTTPAADATPNFAGVTQNPYPITGLANNTTYYFWVRANHTGHGTSAWSSYKSQKTPEACPKPSALNAGDATPNSIKLSWTAGAVWQTAWTIAYSETNNFDPTDETACRYVEADTNVFVVDGLEDDKTYYFRVKGNCGSAYGESAWNLYQASDKTLVACPKPTNLAANNLTLTTADLTWTGYSDSYTVQIREGIPPYLSEDFENGMPANWDNSVHSSNSYVWQVGSTSGNGHSNGTQNAYFHPNTSSSFVTAYLITPAMNLSASAGATLSFSYVNAVWSGGQDELYIYYRVNNGVWTLLGSYTENQSDWTDVTITLEGLADKYQIGFYGTNMVSSNSYDYGYGIGIDNVKVYETGAEVGIWNTATTEATDGAYTLTGLTAGVTYDVQIEGNCDGAVPSDVLTFTTPEFMVYTKEILAHDSQSPQAGGKGWYLIASPVGDIAPADVENMISQTADNYDLYRFNQDEALEWENYKTHTTDFTTLVSGQGYLYANAQTVTLKFTGAPYSGDSKEVPLTYSEDNDDEHMYGWNLIGNPYGTNANLDLPYYRMNDDRSALKTNIETTPVALMEGVFVYAFDETTNQPIELATFTPATRSATMPQSIVNVNVVSGRGSVIDNAIIRFDGGLTLPKFQLNPNHTKVYIPQDGKDYAVVGAGSVGELPVNFKAENNGSYTLSFTAEEVAFSYLHLIDNMTGKDIDLLQAPSYSFNATTNDYESRFRLVFATGSSVDGESFGFFNGNGNFSIIGIEGTATLQVIDVMGRMLSSETFNGSIETKISDVPGVYMLRLVNGNEVRTQKVIVK